MSKSGIGGFPSEFVREAYERGDAGALKRELEALTEIRHSGFGSGLSEELGACVRIRELIDEILEGKNYVQRLYALRDIEGLMKEESAIMDIAGRDTAGPWIHKKLEEVRLLISKATEELAFTGRNSKEARA